MSSLALVDNRPDIDRLKGLIGMMRRTIEEHNDGSGLARFAFILTSFTDELAEEFRDMDEMQIRLYLYKVGQIISWVGHGDNSRLPEDLTAFAELIQPSPVASGNAHIEPDSQAG